MDIIRCMPESTSVDFRRKETRFPYRGVPNGVRGQCRDLLFIANHGRIVAAAPILGIEPIDARDGMEYLEQGEPTQPRIYRYIHTGRMSRIEGSPEYSGHMGIRYVDRLKDHKLRRFLQEKAVSLRASFRRGEAGSEYLLPGSRIKRRQN